MAPQSKFIAVFDTGVGGADGALSIVETNQFKALTYLSLTFRKANDELLKKHLAAKLKDSSMNNRDISQLNSSLQAQLSQSNREREQIQGDMAQARDEVRRVTDSMTIENQKTINEVREKMLLEQAEMQARFDSELKDGRSRHENTQTDLSSKYETLQTTHQDLLDKRREMESMIKEMS